MQGRITTEKSGSGGKTSKELDFWHNFTYFFEEFSPPVPVGTPTRRCIPDVLQV